MTKKFHVNPKTGKVGECHATKQACKFQKNDDVDVHYESENAAMAAYEQKMSNESSMSIKKECGSTNVDAVPTNAICEPKLSDVFDLELLRQNIEEKYVHVRPHEDDESFKVLCYTRNAQYDGHWNDVTKLTRGLIIRSEEEDFSDAVIIARPWRKFFTLQQMESGWSLGDEENEGSAFNEMTNLDFDAPAEVTDKADGSLGILYKGPDGEPALATKGGFGSEQAIYYTKLLHEDEQMYQEAKNIVDNNSNETHLFEMLGPDNRIVLDYDDNKIVLLGTVDKETGEYHSAKDRTENWSGDVVESFAAQNLTEALSIPDRENREGLVVRTISNDPDKQLQIKIKQEDYKKIHNIVTHFPMNRIKETVRSSDSTMADLLKAAETNDITHINGVRESLNIDLDHPLVPGIEKRRKDVIEKSTLPRLKKLKKAQDYVSSLPQSFIDSPGAAKEFAQQVKEMDNLDGEADDSLKTSDLFSMFKARADKMDYNEMSGTFILRWISRNISE